MTVAGEPARVSTALAQHLQDRVDKWLQKLEKSWKRCTSDSPVEAVHDLRVAARRLRAFGKTFRDLIGAKPRAQLERKLKAVAKAVGPLRDWDVKIKCVEGRIEHTDSELERAGLEHLLEHFEAERASAAKKGEKRLRKLEVDDLSSVVHRAARDAVARLSPVDDQRAQAEALLLRLVGGGEREMPPSDGAEHAEQMHRLRISVKELRYALELFKPLLGSHHDVLYERAVALHEMLGSHHDLIVLAELVEERGAELERKNRRALSAGIKLAEDALSRERQQLLSRFRDSGFEPNWWRENLKAALVAAEPKDDPLALPGRPIDA